MKLIGTYLRFYSNTMKLPFFYKRNILSFVDKWNNLPFFEPPQISFICSFLSNATPPKNTKKYLRQSFPILKQKIFRAQIQLIFVKFFILFYQLTSPRFLKNKVINCKKFALCKSFVFLRKILTPTILKI